MSHQPFRARNGFDAEGNRSINLGDPLDWNKPAGAQDFVPRDWMLRHANWIDTVGTVSDLPVSTTAAPLRDGSVFVIRDDTRGHKLNRLVMYAPSLATAGEILSLRVEVDPRDIPNVIARANSPYSNIQVATAIFRGAADPVTGQSIMARGTLTYNKDGTITGTVLPQYRGFNTPIGTELAPFPPSSTSTIVHPLKIYVDQIEVKDGLGEIALYGLSSQVPSHTSGWRGPVQVTDPSGAGGQYGYIEYKLTGVQNDPIKFRVTRNGKNFSVDEIFKITDAVDGFQFQIKVTKVVNGVSAGDWLYLNRESWVNIHASDQLQPTDQVQGDFQSVLEDQAKQLYVFDGNSKSWKLLFGEKEIRGWIAAVALFKGVVQEVGGGVANVPDFTSMPDLAALSAAHDLTQVAHYWTFQGSSLYTVKPTDPMIGGDLGGTVLEPGDWIQVANVTPSGGQTQLKYVVVGGDLLSKVRADHLFGLNKWDIATAYEKGALVVHNGVIYRAKDAPGESGVPAGLQSPDQPGAPWEKIDLIGGVPLNLSGGQVIYERPLLWDQVKQRPQGRYPGDLLFHAKTKDQVERWDGKVWDSVLDVRQTKNGKTVVELGDGTTAVPLDQCPEVDFSVTNKFEYVFSHCGSPHNPSIYNNAYAPTLRIMTHGVPSNNYQTILKGFSQMLIADNFGGRMDSNTVGRTARGSGPLSVVWSNVTQDTFIDCTAQMAADHGARPQVPSLNSPHYVNSLKGELFNYGGEQILVLEWEINRQYNYSRIIQKLDINFTDELPVDKLALGYSKIHPTTDPNHHFTYIRLEY